MNDVDNAKALMTLFLNLEYDERARFITSIMTAMIILIKFY